MQQIIRFIIRYKISLLYVLLLTVAFALTVRTHSFHNSQYFNSANSFTGGIYQTTNNFTSYFGLGTENQKLLEENRRLKSILLNLKVPEAIELDTTNTTYVVTSARVIKNSFANLRNYITINKGKADGLQQDMGVITSKGILGIIENTSEHFAIVQSILNTKSNINAKIKNTDRFGSLVWNTKKFNVVQLVDIPRLVPLKIGDTIVTGASSSIFPENIPIGTIKSFDLTTSKSYYSIDVDLFNDMTNIKNVYIINNLDKPEILQLESKIENGQ
ncbi:rod shape-determining protein MreC [Flavobacteriaceae bacterium KMM 6897]|nr:rod shape-determining protein MreC [Flavobacteriaceae bacterium KMM 6897]MEB8346716.1 rod shape-determining protein MreC [Flavobacteriaceae bacterium KMM 6898]